MIVNGISLSDSDIRYIISDLYVNNVIQNQIIDNLRAEIQKGYNMKLTKNPNGTYLLEPEGKELEVLEWVEKTLGSTTLKDKIQEFVTQRTQQKASDEMKSVLRDMSLLPEKDRNAIIADITKRASEIKVTPFVLPGQIVKK